jgi:hypothetical protein
LKTPQKNITKSPNQIFGNHSPKHPKSPSGRSELAS